MKLVTAALLVTFILVTPAAQASGLTDVTYSRGEVRLVVEEKPGDVGGQPSLLQVLAVTITSGKEKGKIITVEHGKTFQIDEATKFHPGDGVIVSRTAGAQTTYALADVDRTSSLIFIAGFFLLCAIIFGRKRGATAVLGLVFSIAVLAFAIIPLIISGYNPVLVSLAGACFIALCSLFLAHGFNKQTLIAFISTMLTFVAAVGFAAFSVKLAQLSGMAADEAFYLQTGPLPNLDFRGLLLGGMLIGALGVLDDITTSQVAIVYELHDANRNFGFKELWTRALRVGREHIASLVNTLVLAYVGAGLPGLLLFAANSELPFWVALNSEFIAEEAVRSLVGSTALVLAVPISTALAALALTRKRQKQ